MEKFKDKILYFLSSTISASILISLVIISSIIGTFLKTYSVYTSWWYVSLLLLLVISLFTCTTKRFTYLFRRKPFRHSPNLKLKTDITATFASNKGQKNHLLQILIKKGFKIDKSDYHLVAEKNHFNQWGVFLIHAGIIVMALGAMSKVIPSWYMKEYVWVKKGDEISIPQTEYTLKNTNFIVQYHENGLPKLYQTDFQLIDNSGRTFHSSVQVNKPLKVNKLSILQSDYKKIFGTVNIRILDKRDHKLGTVTIDLFNIKKEVPLEQPYVLIIDEYFPNLAIDNRNHPISKTLLPDNPAFIFQIKNTEKNILSDKQWFILRNFTDPALGMKTKYTIELHNFTYDYASGLLIRKDVGKPFVFTGLFVIITGLFIALYFQHKKLWITFSHNEILIMARTNRNIEGLQLEIENILVKVNKEESMNDELASINF